MEKLKDIGAQVAAKTGGAVDTITTSVKDGVESLTLTAGNVTDTLNEKAVRASTAQVCHILELALDELQKRPLSNRRVTLTASVNIGVAALEMHIDVDPAERQAHTSPPDAITAT